MTYDVHHFPCSHVRLMTPNYFVLAVAKKHVGPWVDVLKPLRNIRYRLEELPERSLWFAAWPEGLGYNDAI
jgi:hypothetical protein